MMVRRMKSVENPLMQVLLSFPSIDFSVATTEIYKLEFGLFSVVGLFSVLGFWVAFVCMLGLRFELSQLY